MATAPLRRYAKIRVPLDVLAQMFDLPDGVAPVMLIPTWDPQGCWLVVESPSLPPVPHDQESPIAPATLQRVMMRAEAPGDPSSGSFYRIKVDLLQDNPEPEVADKPRCTATKDGQQCTLWENHAAIGDHHFGAR